MSQPIAVTGVTGRLGGRVARLLAERGVPQRLMVRSAARAPILSGAEFAEASYSDGLAMRAVLSGVDTMLFVSAHESAGRMPEHSGLVRAAAEYVGGMRRTSFGNWPCSVARVADLFGDAWTTLVLREAFYGFRRFDEFRQELGIARNTLTDRLRLLVDEGLLVKRRYQTEPERHEYVLTDKGRDFFPVLAAMAHWGDRWLAGADGPPITFHHHACEHNSHAEVVCAECARPMSAEDTEMRMGPGFPPKLAERPDVRRRFGTGDEH